MSADSLSGMRESIVRAMAAYVEVEAEEAVEVRPVGGLWGVVGRGRRRGEGGHLSVQQFQRCWEVDREVAVGAGAAGSG
jgi:hypothetical protein